MLCLRWLSFHSTSFLIQLNHQILMRLLCYSYLCFLGHAWPTIQKVRVSFLPLWDVYLHVKNMKITHQLILEIFYIRESCSIIGRELSKRKRSIQSELWCFNLHQKRPKGYTMLSDCFFGNYAKCFLTEWGQDNNMRGAYEHSKFCKNVTVHWVRLYCSLRDLTSQKKKQPNDIV